MLENGDGKMALGSRENSKNNIREDTSEKGGSRTESRVDEAAKSCMGRLFEDEGS